MEIGGGVLVFIFGVLWGWGVRGLGSLSLGGVMRRGQCVKCGSAYVMGEVEIQEYGAGGAVMVRAHVEEREPEERPFIWRQASADGGVRAWICASCGYTEMYTGNLAELWRVYAKSLPEGHPGRR
ncbi:hypothetical protein GCM10022221_35590 [Actinocorallia aurea]